MLFYFYRKVMLIGSVLFAAGLCWTVAYNSRRILKPSNLNQTFFSSLENYQVNAKRVSESDYPWIARVVHSPTKDIPHVCTASCVARQIFITAGRCIYELKVKYTSVIYQNSRLRTRVFVFPSNRSKQAFDDIGFLVTEPGHQGSWSTVEMFDQRRTDDGFQWFADLVQGSLDVFKVVGYATDKGIHKIRAPERKFDLTELNVVMDIDICTTILTFNHLIQGFHVPCYHSCSLQDFKNKKEQCKNYHGVEGGALIDKTTNKLLGVATWGAYFYNYELPVGISVLNSVDFFKDYECAKRISNDNREFVTTGHYQTLCEHMN